MTDYQELKTLIESTDKKVDRILSWAEGDEKLGTPSVMQRINENAHDIKRFGKRTYENEEKINSIKRSSGAIGAGGGGIVMGIVEAIKALFS